MVGKYNSMSVIYHGLIGLMQIWFMLRTSCMISLVLEKVINSNCVSCCSWHKVKALIQKHKRSNGGAYLLIFLSVNQRAA